MHFHERTMLASLGFADPDRREQLHDLACQYLATPDAMRRLSKHYGFERGPELQTTGSDPQVRAVVTRELYSRSARHEVEISTSDDVNRTTIGYADLVLTLNRRERHVNVEQRKQLWSNGNRLEEWADWEPRPDITHHMQEVFAVMVKITPIPIRKVIRQVKLYQSYSEIYNWIVATAYGLDSHDADLLESEVIDHFRLGERFREYVAMRVASETETGVEI